MTETRKSRHGDDLRLLRDELNAEEKERRAAKKSRRARLAERDRAFAAQLADAGIPYERVRELGGGLRVRYRGHVCGETYPQPTTTNKKPKGNRTWKLTK